MKLKKKERKKGNFHLPQETTNKCTRNGSMKIIVLQALWK